LCDNVVLLDDNFHSLLGIAMWQSISRRYEEVGRTLYLSLSTFLVLF